MRRRTMRWAGAGLALIAGALGAAFLVRRKKAPREEDMFSHRDRGAYDRWARPGMMVTFRAELMPGRSRAERTYRVALLLPSRRVLLESFAGEHAEGEFEPLRFE